MFTKLINKLLPIFAMLIFISAYVGASQAKDFYYFETIDGLISNTTSSYPFCETNDCTYLNPTGADVSIEFDIKSIGINNGDSVSNDVTLTNNDGSVVELSATSSDEDLLLSEDITIDPATGDIDIASIDISDYGSTKITLTAKVEGNIVDQDYFNLSVVDGDTGFITTWAVSNGDTAIMPTIPAEYSYDGQIDWGDGTSKFFKCRYELINT